MADLFTFTVPDPNTIRDNFLRTMKNGLISRGVVNPVPDMGPGSDWWVEATAISNEISVVHGNTVLKADALMPDTATGSDLTNWGDLVGPTKQRAAGGSFGPVTLSSTATSTVPLGAQLIDQNGLRYQVSIGGSYANGATIPIAAIDSGIETNLPQGSILRWQSPPTFSANTVTVGLGGLVNGVDAENQEGFRQRIEAVLQTPPGAGNWSHVAQVAESSASAVQKAFPYPAAQGPATLHIAVTAAPTATNSSRAVNGSLMTGTVIPYITANLPEHAFIVTTPTLDAPVKVGFQLSLPSSPTANPSGPGGGWLDGSPFPSLASGQFFVQATVVTTATQITCDAQAAPTANVSRIAWFNYSNRQLLKALVIGVSGTAGAWVLTLDTPFTGIQVGDYIFPQSAKQDTYIAAVLAAFELMGPAEKTANASALLRAFRHPVPSTSWPSTLGPAMLKAITDSGTEASAASFCKRDAGAFGSSTGSAGSLALPAADVYATISSPPLIFIPSSIAFYPAS